MDKKPLRAYAGIVLLLGAVWGLSEAALGMWLKNCASTVSGSLMTGFAFLFIAVSWFVSRRVSGVVLLVLVACVFKLFDAYLLSLPVVDGAVVNPIFAFILEGAVFLICISVWKKTSLQKRTGQGFLGGISALGAVGLFPLVKFITGIPACVAPGTSVPLSLYYAPLAIGLAVFTVPFGFWLGEKLGSTSYGERRWPTFVSPLAFLVSVAIVTLIRLI